MKSNQINQIKLFLNNNININKWKNYLLKYSSLILFLTNYKNKENFNILDNWLWYIYPNIINKRKIKYINKEELINIMKWKLLRGKFRPTLLSLIKQNNEENIIQITTKSIEYLDNGEWKNALEKLIELKGVGPG